MNLYLYRCLLILMVLATTIDAARQQPNEGAKDDTLPKEVRGYKVHRGRVELKETKDTRKSDEKSEKRKSKEEYDEVEPLLIRLGEAELVSVTPLGITFDVPVILAAVKQQGDVDRLVFEDIKVNDTAVTLEDYVSPFKLPNKEPLTMAPPLRVFVSTPQAVLRTINEIFSSKDVWPITGRIYVCGHFKKFLFKFKRAVPVELQSSINNPLR